MEQYEYLWICLIFSSACLIVLIYKKHNQLETIIKRKFQPEKDFESQNFIENNSDMAKKQSYSLNSQLQNIQTYINNQIDTKLQNELNYIQYTISDKVLQNEAIQELINVNQNLNSRFETLKPEIIQQVLSHNGLYEVINRQVSAHKSTIELQTSIQNLEQQLVKLKNQFQQTIDTFQQEFKALNDSIKGNTVLITNLPTEKQLKETINQQISLYLSQHQVEANIEQCFQAKREQNDAKDFITKEQLEIAKNDILNAIKNKSSQAVLSQQFALIPKCEERLKCCRELIQKIYDNSWRLRYVPNEFMPFVRQKEGKRDLEKNYSIRSSQIKAKLAAFCNKYRQARGDGNCFYTSFGYQFLCIVLMKYTDEEFNSFLHEQCDLANLQPKLSMKINLKDIKCDDPLIQKQLLLEFLNRIQQLRQLDIQQREEALVQQYAAYQFEDDIIDGCFYGLSTIFFRNLANKVIDNSEQVDAVYDRQNLLIWEEMCDSNEVIIAALAKELKINIQLLFFDGSDFEPRQYEENNKHKIIVLIRPGHYNIGILEEEEEKQGHEQQY